MTDYKSQRNSSQPSNPNYDMDVNDATIGLSRSFEVTDHGFNGTCGEDIADFDRDIDLAVDPSFEVVDGFDCPFYAGDGTAPYSVPSTVTVSSVSESYQGSQYTESYYSHPGDSLSSINTESSLAADPLDELMRHFGIDNATDFSEARRAVVSSPDTMPFAPDFPALEGFCHSQANYNYGPSQRDAVREDRGTASDDHPQSSLYTQSSIRGVDVDVTALSHNSQQPKEDLKKRKSQCPTCQSVVLSRNLSSHMDTHNPDRPRNYVCTHTGCQRAFYRRNDLERHMTSKYHSKVIRGSSSTLSHDYARGTSGGKEDADVK
ncbi:hypothetical protein EIP91_003499 [Steccherinum ochraceum]|uniref:C2H2-type domain-containing protein n=1 Tax=Steccherinum ochraceum TaxID=92696 RepID=A0A4R0S098_9APHY|nr:hypothetical protein EIP91_003499 [Steccherinum ochraceum]